VAAVAAAAAAAVEMEALHVRGVEGGVPLPPKVPSMPQKSVPLLMNSTLM